MKKSLLLNALIHYGHLHEKLIDYLCSECVNFKGEGNFHNILSRFNCSPPLFPNYVGQNSHNAPKVNLLALK